MRIDPNLQTSIGSLSPPIPQRPPMQTYALAHWLAPVQSERESSQRRERELEQLQQARAPAPARSSLPGT